jgi:RimJ/RimL family protein N-acetyltransferase
MMTTSIEAYLRQAPLLHLYELGDLDPQQAPHVEWFTRGDPLDGVALIYRGLATPTLIALAHGDPAPLHDLLASIPLPRRFYAHVSPGLERSLPAHRLLGRHLKMGLTTPVEPQSVEPLHDTDELARFYAAHYPGSYFEPNLAGPYVGLREHGELVCVAGVHVYSPAMRVAALGNIATHSQARGRGLARVATAGLCHRLQREIDLIGLNVLATNAAAIACYRRVGFEPVAEYEELLVTEPAAASSPR